MSDPINSVPAQGGHVANDQNRPEPAPLPESREIPSTWELVMADMLDRDRVGRAKYGTPLQPFNGRNSLVDAYQEALDLVVYLRNEIEERKQEWAGIAEQPSTLSPTLADMADDLASPVSADEIPHPFRPVELNRFCGHCGAGRHHPIHPEEDKLQPPEVITVNGVRYRQDSWHERERLHMALERTNNILGNSPYRDGFGIIEKRLELNAGLLEQIHAR